MATKTETKNARFLRLAQRRLERAKDELRLISQLASRDYEYYPDEAREVVQVLDMDVRHIAEVFGVEYATRIGKAASKATNGGQAVGLTTRRKTSILDEIECMQVIEHIRAGRTDEAIEILRSAIAGEQAA